VINVCFCILSAVFQLRALLYVLCAFVTLNKDYLLRLLRPTYDDGRQTHAATLSCDEVAGVAAYLHQPPQQ